MRKKRPLHKKPAKIMLTKPLFSVSFIGIIALASCGSSNGSSGNGQITQSTFPFKDPSIENYMSFRAQTDAFLKDVDNGDIAKMPMNTNDKVMYKGDAMIESAFFEENQLYGSVMAELDFGTDSGKTEMGGFAIVDPDGLVIVSEIEGALSGKNLNFTANDFKTDYQGSLKYHGAYLDVDMKSTGSFYDGDDKKATIPLEFTGNLTPAGGKESAVEGVGLLKAE